MSTPSASHAVGGIEAGRPQRGRPILAQVDAHRAVVGGGRRADLRQRRGLELDHLRLVDLVHRRARRPVKPVGAAVEPGRDYHDLPDAFVGDLGKVVVVKPGPGRKRVGHPRDAHRCIVTVEIEFTGGHPGEHVNPYRSHQRLGERVVDDRLRTFGRGGARRGNHGGGGSHAAGQVPRVIVGSCHGSTVGRIPGHPLCRLRCGYGCGRTGNP